MRARPLGTIVSFSLEREARRPTDFNDCSWPKAKKLGTPRWSADQGQTGRVPGISDHRLLAAQPYETFSSRNVFAEERMALIRGLLHLRRGDPDAP
jgi:hypothetical protein